MQIHILSLFPEYFQGPFDVSMLKRAKDRGILQIELVDIRDFAEGKSKKVDDKLVYRKQLRKPVDEYTTNVPPHAQAAELLKNPGRIIHYYITKAGPQPIENVSAPLDYEHYIDCQIKPIADSILEWTHLDFNDIVTGQQDLFDDLE